MDTAASGNTFAHESDDDDTVYALGMRVHAQYGFYCFLSPEAMFTGLVRN